MMGDRQINRDDSTNTPQMVMISLRWKTADQSGNELREDTKIEKIERLWEATRERFAVLEMDHYELIFEISGEERISLELSIDRAITEIRGNDREYLKLVSDGKEVKKYEVEAYPVEGRLVRRKMVAEVSKILGGDRHPYFLPLVEKKLEYLTSAFGAEKRRFIVKFNENGTIELERIQGASVMKQTFRGRAPPAPQDSHLFLFPHSK